MKLFCGALRGPEVSPGGEVAVVEVADGATVADVVSAALGGGGAVTTCSAGGFAVVVNHRRASLDTELQDGDEVLFVFPLMGG